MPLSVPVSRNLEMANWLRLVLSLNWFTGTPAAKVCAIDLSNLLITGWALRSPISRSSGLSCCPAVLLLKLLRISLYLLHVQCGGLNVRPIVGGLRYRITTRKCECLAVHNDPFCRPSVGIDRNARNLAIGMELRRQYDISNERLRPTCGCKSVRRNMIALIRQTIFEGKS